MDSASASANADIEDPPFPPLAQHLAASRKRSLAVFQATHALTAPEYGYGDRLRVAAKLIADFSYMRGMRPVGVKVAPGAAVPPGVVAPKLLLTGGGSVVPAAAAAAYAPPLLSPTLVKEGGGGGGVSGAVADVAELLSELAAPMGAAGVAAESRAEFERVAEVAAAAQAGSRAVALRRAPPAVPVPKWHAPWRLKRVVSGHAGWVRAVAVEPGNEWFATGAADRTIKIWDLARGSLKLTLTGHINTVRGLAVSHRSPYLFSCGEDKSVKCWDLETNKVIRAYDGHLTGVYSLALHPTLDVLFTGGRDASVRVWDIRTRTCVHVLAGHDDAVAAVVANATDPQVVSGSMDSTIRLWDLAAGKVRGVLTHHKKAVRALAGHPTEFSLLSGAADALKKWALPAGTLVGSFAGHASIINALAINEDGVAVSGGDDGTLRFWDYGTGYSFGGALAKPQPGSLDSEAGIYAMTFDRTGTRLITCEADKSIKVCVEGGLFICALPRADLSPKLAHPPPIPRPPHTLSQVWEETQDATPETHPIDMDAWTAHCREHKRY